MELILNLVWFVTSVSLIGAWIWSIRQGYIEFEWATLIALVLLIVILFPVISMTDDMIMMRAPAEIEHIMRRDEAPLAPVAMLGLLGALLALVLIAVSMAVPLFYSQVRARVFAARLLEGFIRAFGVRPPPVATLLAC